MSDLVLRALGQAVCLSTIGIFALVMSLVTLSTAPANSSQACRNHHCQALVAEPRSGNVSAQHVKDVAAHLWGAGRD